MSLRTAMSLSVVQAVASIVFGFLSVKITSHFLGPAGVGTMSQLQYVIAILLGTITAGLRNGIVKRTAELAGDRNRREVVVSTILKSVLVLGLPVALGLAAASGWVAGTVLHDGALVAPVLLLAATYLFGLVGSMFDHCANGARDYRSVTVMNVGQSMVNVMLFALLCPTLGVMGGLLATATMPLANWMIGRVTARDKWWWPQRPFDHAYSRQEALAAAAFLPSAAIGAITLPMVQVLLRDQVARHSGMDAVGLIQGVTRLSDMSIAMLGGVGGMYFLPRFAECKRYTELRRELLRALSIVIPTLMVFGIVMYALRDLIIHLLFTSAFVPMRDLFGWQMFGNVFKMTAWVLGYVLIAKVNPLLLIAFELVVQGLWWALGNHLIGSQGALGAIQAYAAAYVAHATLGGIIVWQVLRRMRRADAASGHIAETPT